MEVQRRGKRSHNSSNKGAEGRAEQANSILLGGKRRGLRPEDRYRSERRRGDTCDAVRFAPTNGKETLTKIRAGKWGPTGRRQECASPHGQCWTDMTNVTQ